MNLIDSQTDVSLGFLMPRLAERKDLQDIILGMTVVDDLSDVPSDKFALPSLRKFPVDTMENTFLSKVYFDLQEDELPLSVSKEVGEVIDAYIHLHSIPFDMFEGGYSAEKTASDASGPSHTLLPDKGLFKIAHQDDLVMAGEIFEAQCDGLKLPVRVEFSRNFIKAARDYDIDKYPAAVTKYASAVGMDSVVTSGLLEQRAAAARRHGKSGDAYRQLGSIVKQAEASDAKPSANELTKLAETIHTLDKGNGLEKLYGKSLSCPYTVVFTGQVKEAGGDRRKTASERAAEWTKKDIADAFGESAVEAFTTSDGGINTNLLGRFINE